MWPENGLGLNTLKWVEGGFLRSGSATIGLSLEGLGLYKNNLFGKKSLKNGKLNGKSCSQIDEAIGDITNLQLLREKQPKLKQPKKLLSNDSCHVTC